MKPIQTIIEGFKEAAIAFAFSATNSQRASGDTSESETRMSDAVAELLMTANRIPLDMAGKMLVDCIDIPEEEHDLVVGEIIALTRNEAMKQPAIIQICREILAVHAKEKAPAT